ncbi:transporter substrate-binding domain-containing protein, partial [Rhizobium leguminosarum]|uniref:transporter substrate-binding domain-containing protein n=1 Tax=Rhizobium leguminosarum TaxID=384 RepID=UPI003F9BB964
LGFDTELGGYRFADLDIEANELAAFVEGKWDGLIAGLDAKRYDTVINQVGITETRKQKYDFSEPYIASKAVLIARD